MISVSNVTMRYGSKLLFEDVSVTFTTGRRYGLTGPNGAGKSTFMKVLTGEIDAQKGTVVRPKKIGVLKQDQYEFDAYRVIDTVIMGNKALWAALEEREVIYAKPEMTDEDGSRLGELEGIVGDEDGYEAESNAAVLLQGLDIPDELHERKMSELQGGQKVRVLLAQALFGNPEALLLDEPTNYLDLESIHWLEDFLNRYNGTVITISHDRHFLNNVCTHIADIDYETIITYNGGYDDMVLPEDQHPHPHREPERAARKEDRPAQRLHRPLLRRHPQLAGELPQEGSRTPRHQRTRPLQHRAPLHPLQDGTPLRQERPRVRERQQVLHPEGRQGRARHQQLLRRRPARRQGRPHRPQRAGQDHAPQSAARQRPRHRREGRLHRLRHRQVGTRSLRSATSPRTTRAPSSTA